MTDNSKTVDQNHDGNPVEFPLEGSMQYAQMHATKEEKKAMSKKYKRRNKIVKVLYNIGILSLFRVTKTIALLHTKGRVTGNTIVNPVSYNEKDGAYVLQASRGDKADWIKNIRANPDEVYLRVGLFDKKDVKPEFLSDEEEYQYWEWYVQENSGGFIEHLIGWNEDIHSVDSSDFSKLVDKLTIVRLYPIEE